MERVALKQLLRSDVEQGLNAGASATVTPRSAAQLPRLAGALRVEADLLSNASLYALLEP